MKRQGQGSEKKLNEDGFINGADSKVWIEKDDIKKPVTMNLYARLFQEFKKKAESKGVSASEIINDFLKEYCGY